MKNEDPAREEFRHEVRMAAVQVAGLGPGELAQALAYEVEPLSGIPAGEAEVVFEPVVDPDPTVRVYAVTVRRRTRRRGASGGLDRWLRPACVFAVLVLLATAGDFAWRSRRLSRLGKTCAERRPLQAELDGLESRARAARAAAAAIRSRREAAVKAQDEAAARRAAYTEVLSELARSCSGEVVLTALASGEEPCSLKVRGVGLSGEAAAGVMQEVSSEVEAKGWRLVPDEIGGGSGVSTVFSFDLKRTR